MIQGGIVTYSHLVNLLNVEVVLIAILLLVIFGKETFQIALILLPGRHVAQQQADGIKHAACSRNAVRLGSCLNFLNNHRQFNGLYIKFVLQTGDGLVQSRPLLCCSLLS